jgi:hypothetical protein
MKRNKPLRKGTGRIEISKSKVLRLTDLRKIVKSVNKKRA